MIRRWKLNVLCFLYFRLEGIPPSQHDAQWKKLHLPDTEEEARKLLIMSDMHGECSFMKPGRGLQISCTGKH